MAFANVSPIAVRPGYTGSIKLTIPGATGGTLSVKTAQARETVDNHDTVGTASPTVNGGQTALQTSIQGKARLRLSIGAQYSAGGSGDPPQFGAGTSGGIYGPLGVIAQIGDIIAGSTSTTYASAIAEDFTNSLNESGTIDYSLDMLLNGSYQRYSAAINS
jgi:hypothetical protein